MSNPKRQFSIAVRRLLDAVGGLSDDDFTKLVDPAYNIEIRFTQKKRGKEESALSVPQEDLQALITKLTSMSNREDAQQFLDSNFGTRKSVELIARWLDIPIMKQDKVEVLRDKVIEATVGARIRSEAIQGAKT